MPATHGKLAKVMARDPAGFIGSGLNDISYGDFENAIDSAYLEIEIDAEDAPDTFRWRENGGAWTEDVAITGAEQTIEATNGDWNITFAATTGHTLGDKWVVGRLYEEACTITGQQAQITDAAMRILDRNDLPVFTDSGGANVLRIDAVRGIAYFDDTPEGVTVSGSYVPSGALSAVGYMYGWEIDGKCDLEDITAFQAKWRSYIPGLASMSGSADGYFNSRAWYDRMVSNPETYFLTRLYTYDPDNDGSGDYFACWAQFTGYSLSAPISKAVSEKLTFTVDGTVAFSPNV